MSEILSQNEVDALLRGVSDGQVVTETDFPEAEGEVVPYDLTSQEKIIRGRLPTLEIINQAIGPLSDHNPMTVDLPFSESNEAQEPESGSKGVER